MGFCDMMRTKLCTHMNLLHQSNPGVHVIQLKYCMVRTNLCAIFAHFLEILRMWGKNLKGMFGQRFIEVTIMIIKELCMEKEASYT